MLAERSGFKTCMRVSWSCAGPKAPPRSRSYKC